MKSIKYCTEFNSSSARIENFSTKSILRAKPKVEIGIEISEENICQDRRLLALCQFHKRIFLIRCLIPYRKPEFYVSNTKSAMRENGTRKCTEYECDNI